MRETYRYGNPELHLTFIAYLTIVEKSYLWSWFFLVLPCWRQWKGGLYSWMPFLPAVLLASIGKNSA